jgi:hypothetical protein
MSAEAEGNGRVTMAVLGVQIENLTKQVMSMDDKLDRALLKIDHNKSQVDRLDVRVENVREDVSGLNRRSNILDAVSTSVAAIAALLGLTR